MDNGQEAAINPATLSVFEIAKLLKKTTAEIAERTRRVRMHKGHCRMLAARIQYLQPLIVELYDSPNLSEQKEIRNPMELLWMAVTNALQVMRVCCNAGKVRLLLYGDKITDRLRDVTLAIGNCLDKLPLDKLEMSEDMIDQVAVIRAQFKSAKFTPDEAEHALATEIHAALSSHTGADYISLSSLRAKLIAKLELDAAGVLQEEVDDLKTETQRLRSAKEDVPAEYIDKIIGFLEGGIAPAPGVPITNDIIIDDSWRIDIEKEIVKTEIIGKGGSGEVHKAFWSSGHIHVALKELLLPNANPPPEVVEEFRREVSSHMRLHHPNVVRLYGACVAPPRLCMVQELAELGSLHSVLKDKSIELSWLQRASIARDMAVGLQFLHARRMLHRDIKSLNMLCFRCQGKGSVTMSVKLSDFGLTVTKAETAMTLQEMGGGVCGTPNWTPPEVWEGKPYTRRSEVYSYGMVLYELAARRAPFRGKQVHDIVKAVIKGEPPGIVPDHTPKEYRQLMEPCWARQPEDRPPFSDIVNALNTLIENLEAQEALEGPRGEGPPRNSSFNKAGTARPGAPAVAGAAPPRPGADAGGGSSSQRRAAEAVLAAAPVHQRKPSFPSGGADGGGARNEEHLSIEEKKENIKARRERLEHDRAEQLRREKEMREENARLERELERARLEEENLLKEAERNASSAAPARSVAPSAGGVVPRPGDGAGGAGGEAARKVPAIEWKSDGRLQGHRGTVSSLCLVEGKSLLFSGGQDTLLRVFHKASSSAAWEPVGQPLEGHAQPITSIVAVGEVVFTGSMDKTIKMWEEAPGGTSFKCVGTLKEHKGGVMALVGDGEFLFSGSADKSIKTWYKSSKGVWKFGVSLKEHKDMVTALALDGPTLTLYSGAYDNTVRVWAKSADKKHKWDCVGVLQGHTGPVNALAYSPTVGSLFSSSKDLTTKEWRCVAGSWQCMASFQGHTKDVMALATVGEYVITGGDDGSVILWQRERDSESGRLAWKVTSSIKVPNTIVRAVAASKSVLFSTSDWMIQVHSPSRSLAGTAS
eukprot:jgi/Mesvir1/12635/Mv02191-RA.1